MNPSDPIQPQEANQQIPGPPFQPTQPQVVQGAQNPLAQPYAPYEAQSQPQPVYYTAPVADASQPPMPMPIQPQPQMPPQSVYQQQPYGMPPPQNVAPFAGNDSVIVTKLHQTERLSTVFTIILVIGFSVFNILAILHVNRARDVAYNKLPWVVAQKAVDNFGPAVEDRKDGTLNMQRKVTEKVSHKQDLKAGLNQQINFTSGISYMITKSERNFEFPKLLNYQRKPKVGNEFVNIELVAGNRGTEAKYAMPSLSAKSPGSGSLIRSINTYANQMDVPSDQLLVFSGVSNSTLGPGETTKGRMILEVPKDTKVLVFSYDVFGVVRDGDTNASIVNTFENKAEVTIQ